jgi:hypothetical protein
MSTADEDDALEVSGDARSDARALTASRTDTPDLPAHVYPESLTEDDVAAMGTALPDEVTAAHLRWLETGEGDPWGGYFG